MRFLFTVVLLATGTLLSAQESDGKTWKKHEKKIAESARKGNAVLSLDTIFVNGAAYAVLKVTGKTLWVSDYALLTLDGQEVMRIDYECVNGNEECFYAYTFLGSGLRAEMAYEQSASPFKYIVDYDLVRDNQINASGEARFLGRYPAKFTNPPNQTVININIGGTTAYAMVERNRQSRLQTIGSEIRQDFKLIGTFDSRSVAADGRILTMISVYLPDGTKVAEAKQDASNANTYNIITLKDNRRHAVVVKFSTRAAEDIARFLSESYYL